MEARVIKTGKGWRDMTGGNWSMGAFFRYTPLDVQLEESEPTCYDKRQNQGEEDVDCGGPCHGSASCNDHHVVPLILFRESAVF